MAKKKAKSKAKQPSKPAIPDSITSEVIAEAYTAKVQPVFMKVCRLCESKDGPFLNIFDADKITAKKIDELMPFGIAENDDLPHKICFRCSAKLEELYEFIQKCIKTQENLRTAIGKTGPFIAKTKTRTAWEEKLNKTNMSNDDICDALIKKAMEGIKDIPLKPVPVEEDSPPLTKRVTRRTDPKKDSISDENDDSEVSLKRLKLSLGKCDDKLPETSATKPKIEPTKPSNTNIQTEKKVSESKVKKTSLINNLSFDYDDDKESSDSEEEIMKEPEKKPQKKPEPKVEPKHEPKPESKSEKPFNIMDYISMIKVNGVGVLFQCKLCNRNFLKKEVVESHNCAKNGIPKIEAPKTVPAPEPPKAPTVKYIKMDGDMKKTLSMKSKLEQDKTHNTDSKKNINQTVISSKQEETSQPSPQLKPKPKIGPASKTRRLANDSDSGTPEKDSDSQHSDTSNAQLSNAQNPSVHIPSAPNLNGRYKLVPGPNNIFTLVEDSSAVSDQVPVKENQKNNRKRKSDENGDSKIRDRKKDSTEKNPEVIDLEDQAKPYPVGLFQTVGHSAAIYEPPAVANAPPFTTPAMKKQSYTIVQTGNPSKLLISTKAQAPPDVPKKRPRKSKQEIREDDSSKEPFKVTLEDVAPPKDPGFFTFINVDPLLQPSYVLPTDNIIQESQISTSTAAVRESESSKEKEKYSCNMCGETFTREKKLLAHIQSHYTKMDEEDEKRAGKSKKRGKK